MIIRNKLTIILVLICLLNVGVFAFAEERVLTNSPNVKKLSFFNGRFWLGMTDYAKSAYVTGIIDGVYLSTRIIEQKERKKIGPKVVCNLNAGEISKLISNFYKDTYNLNLPIHVAYGLVVFKANGATTEEYDDLVSTHRKHWK